MKVEFQEGWMDGYIRYKTISYIFCFGKKKIIFGASGEKLEETI